MFVSRDLLSPLAMAFFMWTRAVFTLPKLEYNQMHPYFFWVPLLFYVMVRNSSTYIRTFHSNLLAQMGKITLETYLLQHHIWLADNAKSRFILIPGYPLTNMCITTAIYIYLSFRMFRITIGLRAMLIPNSKRRPLRIWPFLEFHLVFLPRVLCTSLKRVYRF